MRVLLLIILTHLLIVCNAQNNLQLQYGYRGSIGGAKFLPSTLNLGDKNWQIGLNYKVWVSNRALSYGSIKEIQTKGELSEADVDGFLNELNSQNRIGFGQDINLLGMAFKTKFRKHSVTWGVSVTERMSGSFRYPKALLQLAWKGNKQFEDQTVDIAGALDARYFREYALTAATNIVQFDKGNLRLGATLKLFQGIAAIYMPKNYLWFTTGNEGDFVSFDYNYAIFLAGVNDFDPLDPKGKGWGANAGISYQVNNRWTFDVGVSDIGSIKFDKDTELFRDNGFVSFSGISRDDAENTETYADSLIAIFENEIIEGASFRMPIGVRLQAQAVYQFLFDREEKNPGNIFLTYIQGFEELPGVSTRPRFTIGYNQRVWSWLFLGFNSSYGGFNNLTLGGLVSFRVGKTRFGFHSDDFTGAIVPGQGTGVGVGFIFQSYF